MSSILRPTPSKTRKLKSTRKTLEALSTMTSKQERKDYLQQKIALIEQEANKRVKRSKEASEPSLKEAKKPYQIYYRGKIIEKNQNELRLIYYLPSRKDVSLIKKLFLNLCTTCDESSPLLIVDIVRANKQFCIKANGATLEQLKQVHEQVLKLLVNKISFKFNLVQILYDEMTKWNQSEHQASNN